jgi:hypothetical protein
MTHKYEVYRCPVTEKFLDPFRVYAGLQSHAGSGKRFNELVRSQSDPKALMELADVGRKAFGLDPVDAKTGRGVPDVVVLAAVEKFVEYVRGKVSGAKSWRDWLPSQESPPPSTITKPCSACG